jgi:valyl-tRNA synthetase
VNWDTFLQTAVSDDEVFHEEVKGHFWHIRYDVIEPRAGEPASRLSALVGKTLHTRENLSPLPPSSSSL